MVVLSLHWTRKQLPSFASTMLAMDGAGGRGGTSWTPQSEARHSWIPLSLSARISYGTFPDT